MEIIIREPRREDYITKSTAVDPDMEADCPLWKTFLARVTNGDADLQAYLQRVCGYCVTGSTREHALFFFYGTGANGKSVFINTIVGIWKDYATVAPADVFLESHNDRHPTELAMLKGVRLVAAQEISQHRKWNESRLKSITGGDPITARFMNRDFFTYAPQFKLWIAGNHKPGLGTIDEAIRRRLHLIPFTVTIPENERDPSLSDKLRAEWPAIFGWALRGCEAWEKEGLCPPATVRDATAEYLDEANSIALWMEQCCTIDPTARETTKDLYSSWKRWADQNGEFAGTQRTLGASLNKVRDLKASRTKSARCWIGARINRHDYTDDPRYGG